MAEEQNFAQMLGLARRHLGYTQEKMAERCGISLRYYQDVEAGRADPRLAVILRISAAAGLSLDELIRTCPKNPRPE